MKLTIRRIKGDPRDVKLVREGVAFILGRLLTPLHMAKVRLHITLTTLESDLGDVSIEKSPRFSIRLHHEMDTLLMLVTLAHELVHVAQVMQGHLFLKKINGLVVWVWKGQSYGADPYGDPSRYLPWEADAELREGDLACQFFSHYVTSLNVR